MSESAEQADRRRRLMLSPVALQYDNPDAYATADVLLLMADSERHALEAAREENCGWCLNGTPYSDGMHDFDGHAVPCDSLGVRALLDGMDLKCAACEGGSVGPHGGPGCLANTTEGE